MPARWPVLLVALALAVPGAAAAPAQVAPEPEPTPQQLFAGLVAADPGTTPDVRNLLTSRAGYAGPVPQFADLTGDGRMDAVVPVRVPGAAGTIAVYVFSTDRAPGGTLRPILRRQAVYRATTRVAGRTLTVATPRWANGDDLCCPSARAERDYVWSARAKAMRRLGRERLIRLHD